MRRASYRYGTPVTPVDAWVTRGPFPTLAPPVLLSHFAVVPAEIPLRINRQNQSQTVVPMHGWYRTLQVNVP